jgi:hypothetical protein
MKVLLKKIFSLACGSLKTPPDLEVCCAHRHVPLDFSWEKIKMYTKGNDHEQGSENNHPDNALGHTH